MIDIVMLRQRSEAEFHLFESKYKYCTEHPTPLLWELLETPTSALWPMFADEVWDCTLGLRGSMALVNFVWNLLVQETGENTEEYVIMRSSDPSGRNGISIALDGASLDADKPLTTEAVMQWLRYESAMKAMRIKIDALSLGQARNDASAELRELGQEKQAFLSQYTAYE